jgi:hypothetical protein
MIITENDVCLFWAKVDKSRGPNGCWLWQGRRRGTPCTAKVGDTVISAHRAAYTITNGPIPHGLCVCHKCDLPSCVNPAHLFLGTHADNVRDMYAKGRHIHAPVPQPWVDLPIEKPDREVR